ncbi:helix-hairpin-helix domain-containing protein [Chloroflexota bacterium]
MKSEEAEMDNTVESLQVIPGVGSKLAKRFSDIGIKDVADLKGKNPELLYSQIFAKHGYQVDRCVLYVCRLSIYFADTENPDPEKLKWWYWKDKN